MCSSSSLDEALRKEPADPRLVQIASEIKGRPAFHWREYQGPDNSVITRDIGCELPGRVSGLLTGSVGASCSSL